MSFLLLMKVSSLDKQHIGGLFPENLIIQPGVTCLSIGSDDTRAFLKSGRLGALVKA